MEEELLNEIDLLVNDLIEIGVISENKQNSKLRSSAIRFLKSKELIKPASNPKQYHPKSEIYEIKKVGIKEYLLGKQKGKTIDSKIKKKTLFELNNKYLINFGFLVLGSFLTYVVSNISESNNEKKIIEKLNLKISEKNDSITQIQTLLKEKNTLILSLKTEIDSLNKN